MNNQLQARNFAISPSYQTIIYGTTGLPGTARYYVTMLQT